LYRQPLSSVFQYESPVPLIFRTLFSLSFIAASLVSQQAWAKLEIEIVGVQGELLTQAQQSVTANDYKDRNDLGELLIRQLYERGEDQLKVALQPLGYYQASVKSSIKQDDADSGRWFFRYELTAGPRSNWSKVTTGLTDDAPPDVALQTLFSKSELVANKPVDHRDYSSLKAAVQTSAAERGYFDARWIQHQLAVKPKSNGVVPVEANLLFESGERYRFGETVWPELPFSSRYIQRFSLIEAGQPFSAEALRKLQYRLLDSGYFDDVDIVPNVGGNQDKQVPLVLNLELRPRNRYTAGFGVGTDTGIRGTAAWETRWINRRGHRAGVEIQLSEIAQSLNTRYEIPIRDPATDRLRLSLDSERTQQPDSESVLNRGALEWRINRNAWTWKSFIRLENELSTISGVDSTSNLVIPGIGAERTRSDARLRPTRGYRLNLQLLGAHQDVFSDSTFAQITGRVAALTSLSDKWRLKARLEGGMNAVGEFSSLPVSQRFFAGGDSSVRGFAYQSLSPVDSDGEQVGGQYLLAGSVELEWAFLPRYGVALFMDTGNSFDDKPALRRAVGIGFRWQLPIGALRIDVATPIDEDGYSPRLHISLGPDL
jgi:translocation and assembly module TamA